jgi:hypothetical protein
VSLCEAESKQTHDDPYARSKKKDPIGKDAVIISGNANEELSKSIASYLGTSIANAKIKKFADGETSVEIFD